jgi:hypothetical protein
MTVEIFLRKIKSIRNELACDPYYKAKNEYITGLVDMADVAIRILEGENTDDNRLATEEITGHFQRALSELY